jgi:hypothetical protein
MKIKWIVIVISLSVVIVSCISQTNSRQLPDYPGYSDVIVNFLNEYSISGIEYPNQFSLAKKPDGWHAMIIDKTAEKTIRDELYWARKQKSFREINFPPATANASDPGYKSIIENWTNNYYTGILPYWGYSGWDKDIIDEYGKKKKLPDTLLNALARAYVSYASNLLSTNTGFSSKEVRFNLPEGQNALSEKQLAEYREYEHKGIETYYKLWQINPDFETFVADIYNIYSNEVMNCYLTLCFYQNNIEAQTELKEGLYDPFIRDMAKRYLASCDSNAILITNGDIDTYPLLYIQESEGFRKDVSVVNINLLNDGRYISYLRQDNPEREPVPCRLPDEFYWNNSAGYFNVTNQVESSDITEAIDFVASDDPRTKLQQTHGEFDYLPAKKIKMNVDIKNFPDGYTEKGDHGKLIITLDRNYILMSHFCFLDILSTNNFKRPIYFAISVSRDNFLGMEEYFQCEGMAFKITPTRNTFSDDGFYSGYIDTGVQYKKLMEEAAFQISGDACKYYDIHDRMTRNYRMVYGRLAKTLIDENKNDKALRVLNYCTEEFSPEKSAYGYQSLILIESCYRIDQTNAADEMVETLFQSCTNFFEEKNGESLDTNDYDTRLKIQIIMELYNLTSQYIRGSDLNLEIEDTYHSIMNKIYQ